MTDTPTTAAPATPATPDTTATPAAPEVTHTTPATPATPVTPAAPAAAWHDSFDAETKGWLANRGLDKLDVNEALAKAIEGHRQAERHLGVPADRILKLPEQLTGDDMGPVYDRLGRPATADGYEFKAPEGAELDENFVGWAKKAFHAAGISKENAAKLVDSFHNDFVKATLEAQTQAQMQDHTARVQALDKEWGAAREQNIQIARSAATALGYDAATIDKLEAAMGYDWVMKHFHALGTKIVEDSFVTGKSPSLSRILTPEQALSRISDLKADENFRKKYLAGDVEATQEMARLHQMAYPAQGA